jgi:hypothetical protein
LVTTFGVGFTSPIYQATGGDGTYSFSLVSNPVSAGITVTSPLNGAARINVGGSVAAGTYNETLTVTDSSGAIGRYNFTIRVNAPVALSGTQTINTTYGIETQTHNLTIVRWFPSTSEMLSTSNPEMP